MRPSRTSGYNAASLIWLPDQDMAALAERLRTLRETRKMPQARLAALLEIDLRVDNRWEPGIATPQRHTVMRIARLLQVSLDERVRLEAMHSAPAVHNPKLAALCQQVDRLLDADRQALVVWLDSLSKRAHMSKVRAA